MFASAKFFNMRKIGGSAPLKYFNSPNILILGIPMKFNYGF